ncbi:tektin-4 [Astyanax mexicanus]|uniref:Tektin n=1 Tax=Astyanax mexicanus TaxID=7994 RepID=A0A8T2L0V4_ASTMX|nr:tektin-4 [Astyanax mexicanus]
MSSQVLAPRFDPTTVPDRELPVAPSAGLATAGFRSAKYSPREWQENNSATLQRALTDQQHAQRVLRASRALSAEAAAGTQDAQSRGTLLLGARLQDVHSRRTELQRGAERLQAETELLQDHKRRLEKALLTTDLPLTISTDNLTCRENRFGPDLVQDPVEEELLKEVELIRNVQALLKKTLQQAVDQIRLNREAKQTLELDWSDKHEAYILDDQCGRYGNRSTDTQHHPSSARLHDQVCDERAWLKFTQVNLEEAERQYRCSVSLRELCDRVLQETAEDLRAQCAVVDQSFNQRCLELSQAKNQLELQLQRVLDEIGSQERNISTLQQAVYDKDAPLRVAQSRLHYRAQRPNMELCRDQPQISLESEVEQISGSVGVLQQQLSEARQSLAQLEESRLMLEKNISCKTNSLFIDRDKCLTHRTRYPTVLTLSGY